MTAEWRIESVTWSAAADRLMAVRTAVFVDEQGVPAALEHDAYDRDAVHLLVLTAADRAVATARLLADGHVGRMAVLSPWRGRGIGSAMLQGLLQMAAQRGLPEVFLHAQCQAEPFYARLGFVAEGPVFDDAGIPHRCMRRRIDGPVGSQGSTAGHRLG